MRQLLAVILVSSLIVTTISCRKKAEDSPLGPSNTALGWTGTLARPSGLGSMTVSWPATTAADGNFSGPMTLTYNGVAITIPLVRGMLAGNSSGRQLHIDFNATAGQIVSQPSCQMNGASATPGAGDPFNSPFNTINVALVMFYTGCQNFIGVSNLQETAQLNVTK
jgi:hypothetical protein